MNKIKIIKIKKFLRNIGVPTHILGYIYITDVIYYMTSLFPRQTLFIGEIYNYIANQYRTSANCVEVSIRNAIKKTYQIKNQKFLEIFGDSELLRNCAFLTILRDTFEERSI